ncbi:MAG: cell division protein FtsQ/DivIB [Pseudomonadota bacterium]
MSEIAAATSRFLSDIKQVIADKFNRRFTPRRKRNIKIFSALFFLFFVPVWVFYFGASYIDNQGGVLSTIARFTDLKVRNVSMGVYQDDQAVAQADWRVNKVDILSALPFDINDYILDLDPEEIRVAITAVPWVKSAKVKLQLPDHVLISVEENVPYAIWQVGGDFHLIDEYGNIITNQNLERYDYLPWVVGSDANRHVREYVMMMNDFADLFRGVKSAYRVGNRRWNLLMHNNISVNLSEHNPRASLEKLASLHTKYGILDKHIRAIDLRIPTKTFLRKADDDALRLFQKAQAGQDT